MANQYGLFWNSVSGDRTYNADSFAEWANTFFSTGVLNGDLQVTPERGMVVNVGTGYANINGKVRLFDAPTTFTLSPASGTYPRIDTIVVRRNDTARTITLEYVMGAYSGSNPQPTAPTRDETTYEIVLAQIYVNAGATSISAGYITDTRADATICGWITGSVDSVDVDQLTAQAQAQFDEWFQEMKGQLSEDAAGRLQLEIDSINSEIGTTDISEIGDGTVTGAVSALNNGLIDGMGAKLLWSGNFTGSGSITISGLSDWLIVGYTMYSSLTNIEYLMIGTPSRGGLPYGVYDSTSTTTAAYRFLVNGDTITVNSANRGLYFSSSTTYNNGNETHIYHIFGIIKKPTTI